jgi:hypothetical protein
MANWHPLSIGSPLNGMPSALSSAPVIGKLELLPFDSLSWEDFERLQWRVMRDVEGLRHAQLYGDRGQAQHGLDVVALAPDGTGLALQSKRTRRFGPAELMAAVKKFRTTERPFSIDRLVIGVASTIRSTRVVEELANQRKTLQPIGLELWDAQELSYLLRDRPEIVIEFFGMPTADAFCLPFKVDTTVVPPTEVVAVREAIARTPEVATGAQELFSRAAALSDPSQALSLIEAGQARLRNAGFGPHAAQHDQDRIRLLASLDRADEAARYILDEFWAALDQGSSSTAQLTQSWLGELSKQAAGSNRVEVCQRVARVAIGLYINPLAYVPDIASLKIGDPFDQVRIALLAGETSLANDDRKWLTKAASTFTELLSTLPLDRVLHTRLRLLLAETTEDWSELLSDARKLQLGHDLLGLVTARYARHCALHEKFEEADLAWDEASGSASLAQQWGEASTWIFSRRAFRARWNPYTSNDLLPLQTAIRGMGTSSSLLPTANGAYEDALASLSAGKLRSAAVSAQRALRDAVAVSDWAGEDRARRALAEILTKSDEPAMAARHLVRAGAIKAIEALGKSLPFEFIDIRDDLDAPNYWTVGTSYRLLAVQADLMPNDLVKTVSEHLVDELAAAETGSRPDLRSFATSRYNNAVKALAGIADRLDLTSANDVLSHFERQPALEKDYHRYHDEDEAEVVAKIVATHASLAERGIPHLVALLNHSQRARNSTAFDAIEQHRLLTRAALVPLANAGSLWAREMLSVDDPTLLNDTDAVGALTRLTTPLKHAVGVYSRGTNAIGDSFLVRHLSPTAIDPALAELLARADDPHVSSSDRGQYLIAAANLSPHIDQAKRKDYFAAAVRLATSPTPSEHDNFNEQFTHKLGGFRMSGTPRESRGQALVLAASLAVDAPQREHVRRLAYSLLGEESDYWPTRTLQQLGDTVKDDLAFLASQGWAIRCLAATLWAGHGEPAHLGNRLAADPDVRVRRALASALNGAADSAYSAVREQLEGDPAHSVRSALSGYPVQPGADAMAT